MADITDLTINELNMIGRRIGGDPMRAVAEGTEHRMTVLALGQWLLARRADPTAAEATFMEMTAQQLTELYDEQAGDEAPEADPTDPAL